MIWGFLKDWWTLKCKMPLTASMKIYMHGILDLFYPVSSVKLSNRDLPFLSLHKLNLGSRIKNQLMHRGRLEAANAIAERIKKAIITTNSNNFCDIKNVKEPWEKVRQASGKGKSGPCNNPNITAEMLNEHYSKVSTDPKYEAPIRWNVRPHCLKLSSQKRKFSTSLTTLIQQLQGTTVSRPGFWELLRRLCQGRSPRCSISHCPGPWYRSNGKPAWSRQWPRFHVLPLAQISDQYQWLPYYPGFWRRWLYALLFTPYLIILCTQTSLTISSPSGRRVPQLVPLSISIILWLTFYRHTLTFTSLLWTFPKHSILFATQP